MWETLDFRDHALVRQAQRELWREAALRQLAREARAPRRESGGQRLEFRVPRRLQAA